MAKDKNHAALVAFETEIQKVASTITKAVWRRDKFGARNLYSLPAPVSLEAKKNSFDLEIMLEVIPNNGIVKTQSYIYSIFRKAENKPFLEFHWHPEELDRKTMMYKPSKIRFPHIHVTNIDHIPSGRVGLEDVVLFLITELKVEPEKTNWNSILVETSKCFELSKSWGHSPKLH